MGAGADLARVKALFLAVCDLPDDAARRAHLAAQGVDEATAARVMALVARDREATSIAAPVQAALASALGGGDDEASELAPGDRLGPWTLRAPLGEGGMGRVFLAERSDGLYQQQVAIKLLRGQGSAHALALLARERQILATLNHPHIARLLDGGTTPRGRPYLVLEYVQGQRIDQWCAAQQLALAARLALFGQVCAAVAQAHRQLVVHCDIKPANVLVTPQGRAMLLDFGIARLEGQDDEGARGLTPRYASPEQQAGAPATAASDIFSLGRLLAELLAPLGTQAPRRAEWQAIIDRASAPEPGARYADVAALQAELRRFEQHRPLAALPPGWAYRSSKFLRRRWPAVLVAAGAALMAGGFTARLVHERDRALAAEAQARHEAAAAQQVADLLVGLFEGADPALGGRPDMSAAALVDRGRERVAAELQQQPELQARMQAVLGQVYEQMGQPRPAVALFEQAIALEQRLGRTAIEAALLSRMAMALANQGEAARALAPARRALALREAEAARRPAAAASAAGPSAMPASAGAMRELSGITDGPLALADAADTLGYVLSRTGHYDEAQLQLERALALRRRHAGPAHRLSAVTLHHLGMLGAARSQFEAAERHFREALAIKQALWPTGHPSLDNTRQTLAAALAGQQRLAEAEALLRQVLAQRMALLGAHSAPVATAHNELASVLQDSARLDEAIAHYRAALAIGEAVHGRQAMPTAVNLNNLATALEDAGDPAAEAAYRESLAIRSGRLGSGDPSVARAQHNLGRWLLRQGRPDEARPLLEQALATRRARLPPDHADRVDSQITLAELDLAQGRRAAAEAALDSATAHEATLRPARRIGLLRAQGLLRGAQGDAAGALARHAQALALGQHTWPAAHPALRRLRLDAAAAALAQGQPDLARQHWQAVAPALAALPPGAPLRLQAEALQRRLAR